MKEREEALEIEVAELEIIHRRLKEQQNEEDK